jgi:predicted RNA-binding Zn-ribbon protein involved in translation (DUF1610 family)
VIRTNLRTSRKSRRCEGCLRWIHPPDQYLEHVAAPDHGELGNTTWWRSPECRECAVRYDRWPIPNGAVMQR